MRDVGKVFHRETDHANAQAFYVKDGVRLHFRNAGDIRGENGEARFL